MNKKLILFAVSAILAVVSASAQDGQTKKADNEFDDYAYANAIENYERMVKEGFADEEIFKKLGDANYLNARYQDASGWYSKLFIIDYDTVESDYMYRYANSLKSTLEYEASDLWMQRYSEANADEIRAKIYMDNRDYQDKIDKQSGRYDVKNVSFNSAQSDFAPSFKGDKLIFSTARDSGKVVKRINQWDNSFFLNLYTTNASTSADFTVAEKLSNGLNGKTHESSTAFTEDGQVVYFTRNNSKTGGFSRDEEGVSRLKIYRAYLKDGEWTDISALPFNGDDYSCAHPTLSPEGDKLYFSSDMPGSLGESDIFVVDLKDDGSMGSPVNLGENINTEGRETFPFVTKNNVMYFSSDGRPGLGGLDIYATEIEDMENALVINVGKPINSEDDDFSFIINEETSKGFFASNRDGGQGDDDIYGFTEKAKIDLDCKTDITGIVKDQESGQPLAGARVIISSGNEQVSETVSEADGSFSLEGDCKEEQYKLVVTKDDYDEGNEILTVVGATDTENVEIALEKSIKRAAPGTDLVKFLNLQPVYFDLNKADIRPDASRTLTAVIAYTKQFPDMKIEVQSHTDAKASDRYNMALSQKRAENTVTYLIANGVQEGAVTGRGFGKTKLINDCNTDKGCTEQKQQENRRSEFIVIQ